MTNLNDNGQLEKQGTGNRMEQEREMRKRQWHNTKWGL